MVLTSPDKRAIRLHLHLSLGVLKSDDSTAGVRAT